MPPPSTDDPPTSGLLSGVDAPQNPHRILADAEECLVGICRATARLQTDLEADGAGTSLVNISRAIASLRIDLETEKKRVINAQRTALNNNSVLNRMMTDDILLAIFSTVVHNHPGPYPWALAAVCRRWRNVCLDSPALWSQFRLGSTHDCDTDKYSVAPVSHTLLQLERSQAEPLHIIIDAPVCACPSHVSTFQAVIAHSKRWESVALQPPPHPSTWKHTDLEALQKLLPRNTNFAGIQKIQWQTVNNDDEFSSPFPRALPFSDCRHLASLHHLSLMNFGVRLSGDGLGANISWSQLTHLHIGTCGGVRELLLALADCQSLTSLGMDFRAGVAEEVDFEQDSVVLPLLKRLSIDMVGGSVNSSAIPVIPYIRVPNICTMKVGDFSREGLFPAVSNLIERSSCSELIHDLTIISRSFEQTEEDLRTLLQKTPQVRRLTLESRNWHLPPDDFDGSNQAIRPLILDDDEPCTSWLCPRLKELHLFIDPDPMVLMQMVDSRISGSRGQPARLERLEWHSTRDEEEYDFCKAILEQRYSGSGLKYEFRGCNDDDDDEDEEEEDDDDDDD